MRGGFTLTTLNENEYRNNDINRFRRSYKISNSIEEVAAGIEINFKEVSKQGGLFRCATLPLERLNEFN